MNAGKKVVIVGAGFGGLKAARELARDSKLDITLIDRRNYHLFQPLLYQVATAALSPAEIAVPIRTVFSRNPNVKVLMANVEKVDLKKSLVIADGDEFTYDYLVLAVGAKHSYFDHPEWEPYSPGLKTIEQATEIRRRILLAYEMAEKEPDPAKQKPLLTFVIVGGGPTGVELAGAIAEISRYTLERDFRNIVPERARILLIEAGPRILPSFSEHLSRRATRDLEKLGVQIWTSTAVTDVTEFGVKLGPEQVHAKTVIWAAGVQPSSLCKSLGVPLDRVGRVIVEPDLSLKDYPNVFVIGDQAHFPTPDGRGLPGLAPVAMQQGRHAAANIRRDLRGKKRLLFVYVDKGTMAAIGRKKAVAQIKGLEFGGLLAWLVWLFIHIYYLIGFKNRLIVFIQWFWAYVTFKRGARLIVSNEWLSNPRVARRN